MKNHSNFCCDDVHIFDKNIGQNFICNFFWPFHQLKKGVQSAKRMKIQGWIRSSLWWRSFWPPFIFGEKEDKSDQLCFFLVSATVKGRWIKSSTTGIRYLFLKLYAVVFIWQKILWSINWILCILFRLFRFSDTRT